MSPHSIVIIDLRLPDMTITSVDSVDQIGLLVVCLYSYHEQHHELTAFSKRTGRFAGKHHYDSGIHVYSGRVKDKQKLACRRKVIAEIG